MSEEIVGSAAEEAAPQDDFDKAFKEFANPVAEEAPVTEEPKVEAEEPKPEEEPKAVEEPAQVEDEVKSRLEAAEKAAKEWEHRYKSDLGRQAALQRRIQELEKAGATQQAAKPVVSEKFKKLQEDFPEIAEALEAELESRLKNVKGEVDAEVQPIKQDFQRKAAAEAEVAVEEVHEGWRDTVKTTEFAAWFADQPTGIQSLAESPVPKDAIKLLNIFKAETGYQPKVQQQTQSAEASKVAEIKQKREQRLEQNVSIKNSGIPPVADQPDDFDAAFRFYAKKKQAAR